MTEYKPLTKDEVEYANLVDPMELVYDEDCVRSAVMGFNQGKLRYSTIHVPCDVCKDLKRMYLVDGTRKICLDCNIKHWFEAFFEEDSRDE